MVVVTVGVEPVGAGVNEQYLYAGSSCTWKGCRDVISEYGWGMHMDTWV